MNSLRPQLVASGFKYPVSPRWWDDSLYFTDAYGKKVYQMAVDGSDVVEVADLDGMPSGLGELPDGAKLVGEQMTRMLWRLTDTGVDPKPFADLSDYSENWTRDMITAADGITYTTCFGHGISRGEPPAQGVVVMTTADGASRVAADRIMMPNGIALADDGRTLLIAETAGERITAFDRRGDGTLSNRRVWASIPGGAPGGICLDAEVGLWLGSVYTGEFMRVLEGGEVTHRIPSPGRWAIAALVGGKGQSQLFLFSTDTDFERIKIGDMRGRIDVVDLRGFGLVAPEMSEIQPR